MTGSPGSPTPGIASAASDAVLGPHLLTELWGDDRKGLEIPDLALFSSYRSIPTLICPIAASHFLSPRLPAR